jgi:hypothetical protein
MTLFDNVRTEETNETPGRKLLISNNITETEN